MKRVFATLAAMAVATAAFADEYTANGLTIMNPMAFETAPTAKAGGGYMTIANSGGTDDALIGVRADFPKVMIHKTEETDGVARMMHVDRIEIPAGETVELAPGGFHVMFMGLTAPLEEGTSIPATLVFETAGEVEITFSVKQRGMDHGDHGAMDHSGHDHSN